MFEAEGQPRGCQRKSDDVGREWRGECMREAGEGETALSCGQKGEDVVRRDEGRVRSCLHATISVQRHLGRTRVRTKPNPFSLSSFSMIVSRLRNTSPGLFLSCESRGSRVLTWLFGSSFVSIVWFKAKTVYPTVQGRLGNGGMIREILTMH